MSDVRRRLELQHGVFSMWQVRQDGLSRAAALHLAEELRRLHDGVYVTGHGPVTDAQRRWAAVSSAPGTVLSHVSAAGVHGFWDRRPPAEVVTRPGSGGPEHKDGLVVCRSHRLGGEVVVVDGLPATNAGRTVLDTLANLGDRAGRRLVRDALRVGAVTSVDLHVTVARHRGRRAVARLRAHLDEYAPLPARRGRSDAEVLALAILAAAGVLAPELNVRRGGIEADLSWPQWRLIIELDGPSFHRFPTEDARKTATWERAGWTVRRISTDAVYDAPHLLLAAATPPSVAEVRL